MATKLPCVMRLCPPTVASTHRAVSCVAPSGDETLMYYCLDVFAVEAHQRLAPLLLPARLRTHTGIRVQADGGSDLR